MHFSAFSDAKRFCSDLRRCEESARPLIERCGVSDFVEFENIDATAIPYENRFDVIVFKSVLPTVGYDGHMERQERAIEQMYRALRPGGRLLFAENLAASPLHRYMRRRFVEWGTHCRYVTIEEMQAFLRAFSQVEMATSGVLGAFGRSERQRQVLAYVDHCGLNTIVPPAWRYIVYGVATK